MGSKGYKYKKIIAPLLMPFLTTTTATEGAKTKSNKFKVGSGNKVTMKKYIPNNMLVTDTAVNYVHWDNPNELVDRLRLLISSKKAGHTGHDNEIMSIVEELREANIIK